MYDLIIYKKMHQNVIMNSLCIPYICQRSVNESNGTLT